VSLPYVLYVVVVGGDYMAMYRFLVPVLPLIYLLLVGACTRGSTGRSPTLMRAALALGLAGGLVHSTPLESRWVRDQPLMHGNYRGVEKERWYVQRHEAIGRFFARYAEPQESIATSAIGAVAYFSGLRVFDVHGIVDPHIAHSGSSPGQIGTGLPGHEKTDFPYLFSRKPTFYIFNRSLFPKPFPGLPHLTASVDGVVRRDYQVGSVWLEDEANSESGYFAFLQRRDRNSVATGSPHRSSEGDGFQATRTRLGSFRKRPGPDSSTAGDASREGGSQAGSSKRRIVP
jgi:hypothetical protein